MAKLKKFGEPPGIVNLKDVCIEIIRKHQEKSWCQITSWHRRKLPSNKSKIIRPTLMYGIYRNIMMLKLLKPNLSYLEYMFSNLEELLWIAKTSKRLLRRQTGIFYRTCHSGWHLFSHRQWWWWHWDKLALAAAGWDTRLYSHIVRPSSSGMGRWTQISPY